MLWGLRRMVDYKLNRLISKDLESSRIGIGDSIKRIKCLTIILTLSLVTILFAACGKEDVITDEVIEFQGDVASWATIQDLHTDLTSTTIKVKDNDVDAYLLIECIEACQPVTSSYDVYIKARDGFMVKLEGDTIDDTYITHIEGQGWSYISNKHPVNSGVKHINEIIVVTDITTDTNKIVEGFDPDDYGLNIIVDNSDKYFSKGELMILNDSSFILEDGISTYEDISIEVLQAKNTVSLSRVIDSDISKLICYTKLGEEYYDYNNDGFIEVTSDQINYITSDLKTQKLNIVGLMLDPNGASVTDNYYDSEYYLSKGEKVLSILLDGFSYEQYEFIKKQYPDLVLSNIDNTIKARSVYKPVTNAGFAAIISGVEPSINGVLNRDYRELKSPTIFDYCEENGYSHVLIEGNVNILNINTKTHLNIDLDENGFTDNEIMDTAKEVLEENYNYTYIHFHSIDEFGHAYGPLADETINQIILIDSYIEEILAEFDGRIILTADHGMHKTSTGGDHGDFRFEDLFVPYMVVNGGSDE